MIFLKLGGSLLTEKDVPERSRPEMIELMAGEIAAALAEQPGMRLLIGHGSGSFGHSAAARYGLQRGAATPQDWLGFQAVWWAAHALHRQVIDALIDAGLPALSYPPSASAICEAGQLVALAVEPIQRALEAGLLPVVMGDVAFDRQQGAAIVSTEQVMAWLAGPLSAQRILLAGEESGVYAQYPQREDLLLELSQDDLDRFDIGGAQAADVTGGMAGKVRWALQLAQADPAREVRIFCGSQPGLLRQALLGASPGTWIRP